MTALLRSLLRSVAALLCCLTSLGQAADPAPAGSATTYTATVSGIMCDHCKASIRRAFTAKLPGVTSIAISAGSTPGIHSVAVTSTAPAALTAEQAKAALGSMASTYQIKSWDKVSK